LALGYWDSRDNAQTGLSVPAGQTLVHYTVYGDATGDNKTDIKDFAVWSNNYLTGARWSQGEFNFDGKVDIKDFAVWSNAYLKSVPAAATAANTAAAAARAAAAAPATLTGGAAESSASAAPAATLASNVVELDVDPSTGQAYLASGGVQLTGVQILSNGGSLVPANWKSITVTYGGQDSGGWTRQSRTVNALTEIDLQQGDFYAIGAGQQLDYGKVFKVGGAQDLAFTYTYFGADNQNHSVDGVVAYAAAATPEPTTLALAGVAAMGLLGRRRRRAK